MAGKNGNGGSSSALQKALASADALDLRRQRQIKNQAARMDSMKVVIQTLAAEVQKLENELHHMKTVEAAGPMGHRVADPRLAPEGHPDHGWTKRSIDQIIADASK